MPWANGTARANGAPSPGAGILSSRDRQQMHDAQEFELDALISGDEADSQEDPRESEKIPPPSRPPGLSSRNEEGSESSGSVREEGRLRL